MLTTCVLLTMSKTPAPANIQAKLCETQTHHNRETKSDYFFEVLDRLVHNISSE